jgi:hypothetical protein
MHFSTKIYLKNNYYNITKHSQIASGGEFEYAGSAQRSEKGKFSFTKPISS